MNSRYATRELKSLDAHTDGPAVVRVNIFVRSISKIDDVTMVSVVVEANINYVSAKP